MNHKYNFILSDEANNELNRLREEMGGTRSAVIEQLILAGKPKEQEGFLEAFEKKYHQTLISTMLAAKSTEKMMRIALEMLNAAALDLPGGQFFPISELPSDTYSSAEKTVEAYLSAVRQKAISNKKAQK